MKIQLVTITLFLLFSVLDSNAQKKWIRSSDGLPADTVLSLAKIGNVLFVGTENSGVYKSTDYGNNWIPMPTNNAFKNSSTWSMATIDTFLFAALRGGGILRTSINGTRWDTTNYGIGRGSKIIQDIISVGSTLYAATYGGGVLISTDSSKSWSVLYNHRGIDDRNVFSLAYNSKYLFAGTAGINKTMPDTGVAFVTPFGGDSWHTINNGFVRNGAHLEGVSAMCANDSVVYAGTDDVGIFRSTDNGQVWHQVPNSNLNGDVHSILIAGKHVYYGTLFGGIFSSDDNGISFSANNIGLNYQSTSIPYLVKDFVVLGDTIYAATTHGVYKQTLPTDAVGVESGGEHYGCPSIQVTPVNSTVQIMICAEEMGSCRVSVYTTMGQKTRPSEQHTVQTGMNHIQFDVNGLAPGGYYVQVCGLHHILAGKFFVH